MKAIPFTGWIAVSPKNGVRRKGREIAVYAAGPGANFLLGAAAIGLFLDADSDSWEAVVFGIAAGCSYLSCVASLLPLQHSTGYGVAASDGFCILRALTARGPLDPVPVSKIALLEGWMALQAERFEDAERSMGEAQALEPDVKTVVALGTVRQHLNKHRQARELYLDWIGRTDVVAEHRATLCNNLAWADLMIGDPALLEEADQRSLEAFEVLPWLPHVKGTRGALLVETNRCREGKELLLGTIAKAARKEKAIAACYLAMADFRLNCGQEAWRYVARARKYDPACPLLERATREGNAHRTLVGASVA